MASLKFHLLFVSLTLLGNFSLADAAPEPDGKAIIEAMINNLRDRQNISQYEMAIERPKWTRSLQLKVWDSRAEQKVFIAIQAPAKEKDKTFLRIGYNLWMYLPDVEKVIKIPSSMMLQPWMGSDFTNDDLVKEGSYIDDYSHEIVGTGERDGLTVFQIKLTPKPHAPVIWGSVVFWVRQDPYLPLQQNFYNEAGELIKELQFTVFKKMSERLMPTVWTMNNIRKTGERTILKLNEIEFMKEGIDENVFTQSHLKNP